MEIRSKYLVALFTKLLPHFLRKDGQIMKGLISYPRFDFLERTLSICRRINSVISNDKEAKWFVKIAPANQAICSKQKNVSGQEWSIYLNKSNLYLPINIGKTDQIQKFSASKNRVEKMFHFVKSLEIVQDNGLVDKNLFEQSLDLRELIVHRFKLFFKKILSENAKYQDRYNFVVLNTILVCLIYLNTFGDFKKDLPFKKEKLNSANEFVDQVKDGWSSLITLIEKLPWNSPYAKQFAVDCFRRQISNPSDQSKSFDSDENIQSRNLNLWECCYSICDAMIHSGEQFSEWFPIPGWKTSFNDSLFAQNISCDNNEPDVNKKLTTTTNCAFEIAGPKSSPSSDSLGEFKMNKRFICNYLTSFFNFFQKSLVTNYLTFPNIDFEAKPLDVLSCLFLMHEQGKRPKKLFLVTSNGSVERSLLFVEYSIGGFTDRQQLNFVQYPHSKQWYEFILTILGLTNVVEKSNDNMEASWSFSPKFLDFLQHCSNKNELRGFFLTNFATELQNFLRSVDSQKSKKEVKILLDVLIYYLVSIIQLENSSFNNLECWNELLHFTEQLPWDESEQKSKEFAVAIAKSVNRQFEKNFETRVKNLNVCCRTIFPDIKDAFVPDEFVSNEPRISDEPKDQVGLRNDSSIPQNTPVENEAISDFDGPYPLQKIRKVLDSIGPGTDGQENWNKLVNGLASELRDDLIRKNVISDREFLYKKKVFSADLEANNNGCWQPIELLYDFLDFAHIWEVKEIKENFRHEMDGLWQIFLSRNPKEFDNFFNNLIHSLERIGPVSAKTLFSDFLCYGDNNGFWTIKKLDSFFATLRNTPSIELVKKFLEKYLLHFFYTVDPQNLIVIPPNLHRLFDRKVVKFREEDGILVYCDELSQYDLSGKAPPEVQNKITTINFLVGFNLNYWKTRGTLRINEQLFKQNSSQMAFYLKKRNKSGE